MCIRVLIVILFFISAWHVYVWNCYDDVAFHTQRHMHELLAREESTRQRLDRLEDDRLLAHAGNRVSHKRQ